MGKKEEKPYLFRFHVSGETSYTDFIVENIITVFNEKIAGVYELEVNNVLFKPKLAKQDGVTLTPALVKLKPDPKEVFSGMFNKIEKLRVAMGFLDELEKARKAKLDAEVGETPSLG